MKTLYYSHPDFLFHQTGAGHPECPDRIAYIDRAVSGQDFAGLIRQNPPLGSEQQVRLIHPQFHINAIVAAIPEQGTHYLDQDTVLSTGSGKAAFRAVGAVCDAVDNVLAGTADNAFCAVRPPGHHAEPALAMGFCLFNNIAIAAAYAQQHHQLERIAIVDFDVHHGNGTQAAFYHQPNVLYASSHEMPHYPGTGYPEETGAGNIINVPLAAGDSGNEFRQKYRRIILPALEKFKPELLLISAGFDAHKDDPLASIGLVEADFAWITQELMGIADSYCHGRIISALEGGYNLNALAASAAIHIKALMAG
ncbi:MAG: histone deacetylase family protein [Methylobacter sp.]|nr:histone deacetylase family protein [Methylobacter sp.]MDP2100370.1 histone deacetylase family protein [Methylobacter sp.]MDP2427856.1 histone deacetylase family protein [Methylobacter sp.]MDP3053842.1 histone deacetylase family protein [Methylobacter sp.]MDP3363546.1 histone deacetylase family protein [Methylobacter sp.]